MNSVASSKTVKTIENTSVRVERNFFTLVRWAFLISAVFAIIATGGMLVTAAYQMTRSANTNLSPSNPKYSEIKDQFKDKKDQESTTEAQATDSGVKQKQAELALKQAELDFEKKLKPYIDNMYKGLSLYSKTVDQPPPSAEALLGFVKRRMNNITRYSDAESLQWNFVDGLAMVCVDLGDDAQRISKLSESARPEWQNVIEWYSNAFDKNFSAEQRRVQNELANAAASKVTSTMTLMGAGYAFSVFAALIIILVLLRIENNTRAVITH